MLGITLLALTYPKDAAVI